MRKTLPQKKAFLLLLVLSSMGLVALWSAVTGRSRAAMIRCYHELGNRLTELSEREPLPGRGLFFHETSCPEEGDIPLTPRQACSIESALVAHPKTDVFLLITSPVNVTTEESQSLLVKTLLIYPNMKFRHINFARYLWDTPLSPLLQSGALNHSRWPVSHASDLLRYTTLYKFGGTYLDLDVLVLKPLDQINNFAGAESDVSVGSGIINFGVDEVGREMARDCIHELAKTFDGRDWGTNGPGVITRVLTVRCNTPEITRMSDIQCRGFTVHPISTFSPLTFRDPELFFTSGKTHTVERLVNSSYTVHYWNKLSGGYSMRKNDDVPYLNYARTLCPRVFEAVGGEF